ALRIHRHAVWCRATVRSRPWLRIHLAWAAHAARVCAFPRCGGRGIPPTRRAGDVRDRGARRPPRTVPGGACASDPRGGAVTKPEDVTLGPDVSLTTEYVLKIGAAALRRSRAVDLP